jgi:thiol:disulfide interchange protein
LYDTENRENGPFPTSLEFEGPENSSLFGSLEREKPIVKYDSIFEMNVGYYENQTTFTQKIKLKNHLDSVNVLISYMACDEKRCLPPKEVLLSFNGKEVLKKPIKKGQQLEADSEDLLSIFILAFLFGFTALLTPCVFPMIPLTVSFFTKQSKNKLQGIRNALLFGASIVFIYVFLGILITMLFGSGAMNALATNIWFNFFMFLLLGVFAFSFLGAFEINLPNSWANALDKKSSKKGFIGIFFMALALAVISFSCTGPIVGTLLVQAATGQNLLGPIIGMFGFSMAIAIPFTLFAAFPGWMNSLPKSGSWLQTVKVVLGFLELAFALKFLSNIDLVLQLEILNREVFLSIWLAIFMCLTMYLFGFIILPHHASTFGKDTFVFAKTKYSFTQLEFHLVFNSRIMGRSIKTNQCISSAVEL